MLLCASMIFLDIHGYTYSKKNKIPLMYLKIYLKQTFTIRSLCESKVIMRRNLKTPTLTTSAINMA